jgi:hypothetical protein
MGRANSDPGGAMSDDDEAPDLFGCLVMTAVAFFACGAVVFIVRAGFWFVKACWNFEF